MIGNMTFEPVLIITTAKRGKKEREREKRRLGNGHQDHTLI